MALRERRHEDPREAQQPVPTGATGANTIGLREDAERLLARGAEAIERALSGNSAVFLAATRQQGGQ